MGINAAVRTACPEADKKKHRLKSVAVSCRTLKMLVLRIALAAQAFTEPLTDVQPAWKTWLQQ